MFIAFSGCLLPFLIVTNLLFGKLFFKTGAWLAIEGILLVIVSDSSGNTAGGSNSPILNNVVPSHTHSFTSGIESIGHNHNIIDPGHSHTTAAAGGSQFMVSGVNGGINSVGGSNSTYAGGTNTASAPTGITLSTETTNHTHSGTTDNGSSQTNWTPRYLTMIICTKS